MSSEADDQMRKPDEDVGDEDSSTSYEPNYSEPSYETSEPDTEWTVPSTAESEIHQTGSSASAPDAFPLTDAQADEASSVQPGSYWNEGAPVSGGTANSRVAPPPQEPDGPEISDELLSGDSHQQQSQAQASYDQPRSEQQASPGQQAPWGSAPQQPYQGGGRAGSMPSQPNYGGPMSMGPGMMNPNYLTGPSEQGRSTVSLDYWLSAFFSWIPALIFYLTEKDKNKLMDEHTKELLNFNITRMIVAAVMVIPILGQIFGGIASIALFVIAIMGALKGPDEYAAGRTYQFPLTLRLIK